MDSQELFARILESDFVKKITKDYDEERDAERGALREQLASLATTRERDRPVANAKLDRARAKWVKAQESLRAAVAEVSQAESDASQVDFRYRRGIADVDKQARAIADPRIAEFVVWCRAEHARLVGRGAVDSQDVKTSMWDFWRQRFVFARVTNEQARVAYIRLLLDLIREAMETPNLYVLTSDQLTAWLNTRRQMCEEERINVQTAVSQLARNIALQATTPAA